MSRPKNQINGWINLNKPLGLSSAQAVGKAKWLLKPSKIGHAGTLDPLATGVLPLALGEATKCVNLLMDAKKTYEFEVTFGECRSTGDAEGEITATSDHMPDEAQIRAVLPQFTGPIRQTPPAYSALKIDGKRAYELARAGEKVILKEREVTVYGLELLVYEAAPQQASSPGGRRLEEGGVPRAHVSEAQRERIQQFAHDMRKNATDAEQLLWNFLRAEGFEGLKFRRQQPIDHYIVDFVCMSQRLIIEVDGGQHADSAQDALRTTYLEAQGFKVVRFWNNEVLENIEGVLTAILTSLEQTGNSPSPNPLPRGERARARFRATVSKGTYIRSLGLDIARACGSEGYISRLHRAAVGPFSDKEAISLDFLEKSAHMAPSAGECPWLLPLSVALDDIPALSLTAQQAQTLRHGQQPLTDAPDLPLAAAMLGAEMVGLVKVEAGRVVAQRLLNTS